MTTSGLCSITYKTSTSLRLLPLGDKCWHTDESVHGRPYTREDGSENPTNSKEFRRQNCKIAAWSELREGDLTNKLALALAGQEYVTAFFLFSCYISVEIPLFS